MKILAAILMSVGIPAFFVILDNNNKSTPQNLTSNLILSPAYEQEDLTKCFFWVPEDEASAKILEYKDEK